MFDLWFYNLGRHKHRIAYLKCKTCGVKFDSGIVMEKRGLESIKFVDNQHTCPKGHIHTYKKKDYFF